nr:sigma-70 family RNA polymerase sigma factor [Micromonospora sp. DSM 115978]
MSDVSADRSVETAAGDADLARARDGDEAAFARLVGPLRGELHAHSYRLLGSTHDAEDALQDALLRAWRGLAGFEGRGSLRGWLYVVTTRTCLDLAAARGRRALPVDLGPASDRAVVESAPVTEVAWLTPYPDARPAGGPGSPHARYEQREAVELAFVAALQHLPGNQRAALLLCDVLGFSADEVARIMDTSAASVSSALARARRLVTGRVGPRDRQPKLTDPGVRDLVGRYAGALERGDVDALVALLTEDVTWSMPPLAHWYRGVAAVTDFAVQVPMTRCPSWRWLPLSANGQPAVAFYLGDGAGGRHVAWSITVLTLHRDKIKNITSFLDAGLFPAFGLPASLP